MKVPSPVSRGRGATLGPLGMVPVKLAAATTSIDGEVVNAAVADANAEGDAE